jgi:hypothetical protein
VKQARELTHVTTSPCARLGHRHAQAPARPQFLLLAASILLASHVEAQSIHELLERARYTEEARGDLPAAIDLYGKVAAATDADRPTIAQALLRLGMCHMKLGRKEAGATFYRLKSFFPEQKVILQMIPEGVSAGWASAPIEAKGGDARQRCAHVPLSDIAAPAVGGRCHA